LSAGIAWFLLTRALRTVRGADSVPAKALGRGLEGKALLVAFIAPVPPVFMYP
jgi:hypothetical protein